MDIKIVKNELQHIIQGTSNSGERTLIETIAIYLRTSSGTSSMAKNGKYDKQE